MTLPSVPQQVANQSFARAFAVDGERSAVRFSVGFLGWRRVRGSFSDLSGRIVESGDPGRSTGEIRLRVAAIRTGNRLRDRHLRSSHYFDAVRFPEISFRTTTIRSEADRERVIGQLTVRGVSREVEVVMTRERARITSPDRDGRLRLRGTMRIDRLDFGVRGAGLLGLADGLIGRTVDCEIDLEASRIA